VLNSGYQQGWLNMATDDALLTWLDRQPPNTWVLHCYQWRPATLSVGIHQRQESIEQAYQAVARDYPDTTIPVTRRPTGGRAIFHHQDISFAIATNAKSILNAPLAQRYNTLSQPLVAALTSLGTPPVLSGHTSGGDNQYAAHPLCFTSHTPWDILHPHTREKLAGCAQVVRRYGILQHGAVFVNKLQPTPTYPAFCQQLTNALSNQLATQLPEQLGDTAPKQMSSAQLQPQLAALAPKYADEADQLQGLLSSLPLLPA
jgi:lipoate-protein ligase A